MKGLTKDEVRALRTVLSLTKRGRGYKAVRAYLDGEDRALDYAPTIKNALDEAIYIIRKEGE